MPAEKRISEVAPALRALPDKFATVLAQEWAWWLIYPQSNRPLRNSRVNPMRQAFDLLGNDAIRDAATPAHRIEALALLPLTQRAEHTGSAEMEMKLDVLNYMATTSDPLPQSLIQEVCLWAHLTTITDTPPHTQARQQLLDSAYAHGFLVPSDSRLLDLSRTLAPELLSIHAQHVLDHSTRPARTPSGPGPRL
jgi:hypothetical protein